MSGLVGLPRIARSRGFPAPAPRRPAGRVPPLPPPSKQPAPLLNPTPASQRQVPLPPPRYTQTTCSLNHFTTVAHMHSVNLRVTPKMLRKYIDGLYEMPRAVVKSFKSTSPDEETMGESPIRYSRETHNSRHRWLTHRRHKRT